MADTRYAAVWKKQRELCLLEDGIPNIFAVGDNRFGTTARRASAVGEGSMAVKARHRCIWTNR